MIPHLPGWTRDYDGDAIVMHRGGDPELGFIRYLEHLGPVAPPAALLAQQLARDPGFSVDTVSDLTDLVTAEGEYAAMVTLRGHLEGEHVQRDIGWVYGDAHVARVSSLTPRPELFATFTRTVKELVLADEQHLGVRRRRYRHAEPAGWRRRQRGLAATVYQSPDGGAQIDVAAALPCHATGRDLEAQLEGRAGQGGVIIERRRGPEPVVTGNGLGGRVWELDCRQGCARYLRRVAMLVDERYLYSLRLDSATGAGRDTFDAVLYSVEPLPGGRRPARAAAIEALSHWC
jgi:hypothetical protein